MICRENYEMVQAYLKYHADTMQHDPLTVNRYWVSLRHLLEWADDVPFPAVKNRKPTFPTYLIEQPNKRRPGAPLSLAFMNRIAKDVRTFLIWAKRESQAEYAPIPHQWIESLRLPRSHGDDADLKPIKAYTIEEVRAMMAAPAGKLVHRRDRAAVAFLFLSAIRVTAFCTLPVRCVDIERRRIEQLPAKGVRTKNRKAAVTTLLPIDDLLEIVAEWDAEVHAQLPVTSMWYALAPHKVLEATPVTMPEARVKTLRRGMEALCDRAGVAYKGPHALRHGHALYGIQHARTIEELKAVSMNMMHSDIATTDGKYGNLSPEGIGAAVAKLGGAVNVVQPAVADDPLAMLQLLLELVRTNPDGVRALLASR